MSTNPFSIECPDCGQPAWEYCKRHGMIQPGFSLTCPDRKRLGQPDPLEQALLERMIAVETLDPDTDPQVAQQITEYWDTKIEFLRIMRPEVGQ